VGAASEARRKRSRGSHLAMRAPFSLKASVAVLVGLHCFSTGLSQMALPFTGQGADPPEPRDVYVSAMMERLLEVDDRNYRFENVVYMYLSWDDADAAQAMREATLAFRNGTSDQCNRPCYSGGGLSTQSTGFAPQDSCCDGLWLPTIGMLNVYELPEGRLQPYGIIVDQASSGVAWWTAIHAVYFTPMDFRRFPFDTQELDMQFTYQPSIRPSIKQFIPSAFSTRFLVRGDGDTVSGWDIQSIEIIPRTMSLQAELDYFIGTWGEMSAASDPNPITGMPGREGFLGQAQRVGFDIHINITRLWRYYVLNMIVPILLLAALSLVTYVVPPESLDGRIALNLTIFLALTALQFVINDQLPRSSYPSAVLKLLIVSYCAVALAVPESIIVFAIARSAKVKEEMASPRPSSLKAIGENEPEDDEAMHGNMSIAMKVLKKPGKAAFILDMVSLVVVLIVVVLATILVVLGF